MLNLIAAWGQLYPCKLCRTHLQQQLRDPALGPPKVSSRQELSTWVCELHNIVNADLGKEQVDCMPFKVDMMYLKDCGECEITKKPGKEEEEEFLETIDSAQQSDVEYLGPWEAEIYRRDPALFATVGGGTDAWETKDLVEVLEAMDVMRKWFRAFTKEELEIIRGKMMMGEDISRGEIIDKLDRLFRPAMNVVKAGKEESGLFSI